MKKQLMIGLLAAFCATTYSLSPALAALKVGDTAPDFTLLSDEWKTVKLSDFHGKKNVFLAVYVLAFTGG